MNHGEMPRRGHPRRPSGNVSGLAVAAPSCPGVAGEGCRVSPLWSARAGRSLPLTVEEPGGVATTARCSAGHIRRQSPPLRWWLDTWTGLALLFISHPGGFRRGLSDPSVYICLCDWFRCPLLCFTCTFEDRPQKLALCTSDRDAEAALVYGVS